MICEYCNYNSDISSEELNWMFWKLEGVYFEFERQEFTDVKEILKTELYLCPKCGKAHYEMIERKEIED